MMVNPGFGRFGFDCGSLLQPLRRRSEEHTSELQSRSDLVCRLLLEKKKKQKNNPGRRKPGRPLHPLPTHHVRTRLSNPGHQAYFRAATPVNCANSATAVHIDDTAQV